MPLTISVYHQGFVQDNATALPYNPQHSIFLTTSTNLSHSINIYICIYSLVTGDISYITLPFSVHFSAYLSSNTFSISSIRGIFSLLMKGVALSIFRKIFNQIIEEFSIARLHKLCSKFVSFITFTVNST